MTTDPTETAKFRQYFTSVLEDLQENGTQDPEAMALLGSLAAELSDNLGQNSWSEAKTRMNGPAVAELLQSLETHGNALQEAGQVKHAYAIQALAVSVLAMTRRSDISLAEGEHLLDALIDYTVALHRQDRTEH